MPPSPPTHVLETCLYVHDLTASISFYKSILCLTSFLIISPRMAAFSLGSTTLLLFQLGLTAADSHPTSMDCIPGHGPGEDVIALLKGGQGLKQHYCLAVQGKEEVREWEMWFAEQGVKVLGTMDWERGGRSVYFADLDGHVGEIGSRGIWGHY